MTDWSQGLIFLYSLYFFAEEQEILSRVDGTVFGTYLHVTLWEVTCHIIVEGFADLP